MTDAEAALAELSAHPLLGEALPAAGAVAMKRVPSWPRAQELAGRLGHLAHLPAVPVLARLWTGCPIVPVRLAAGHALGRIGTPEAHAVLQGGLETGGDSDPLTAFLAIKSIVATDPAHAFDRLQGHLSTEAFGDPVRLARAGEILRFFGPSTHASTHAGWNLPEVPSLLRAEPRWVAAAVGLRRHALLGESARLLLQSLERDEVEAALRRYPDPPPVAPAPYTGPRDFLAGYERGDHIAVWRALAAIGPLPDQGLREEAAAVARATMARVRTNVELVTARLRALGYPFEPETPPWAPPAADVADQLGRIEAAAGGPLPAALRAFWEVVGEVRWTADDDEREQARFNPELTLAEADPLYVASAGDAGTHVDEWRHFRTRHHPEVVGPLQLSLAPDHLHKANLSGGPPYVITVPNAAADAILENEANELRFVDYLRLCFAWGGFPRLAGRLLSPPARALLDGLRRDLLPF